MSTTPVTGAKPQGIDPLIRQLVDRIDRDRDGRISTDEFGSFLTDLIRREQTADTTDRPAAATAPQASPLSGSGLSGVLRQVETARNDAPDDETPEPPADIPPSAWTDNNAPYGVTFAGFSPQNHTHLTVDDLGVPGKAEKYAVYMYLLSNRVQPTKDWAPEAAKALNARYKTDVFRAIDGETLGYGTEFVHSAPNGYGMLPGQYDRNATGEFFWGTREA